MEVSGKLGCARNCLRSSSAICLTMKQFEIENSKWNTHAWDGPQQCDVGELLTS
jgi:hypothetical protein